MGDNRNHSSDSRFWGVLKRDRIVGKAALRFWPLNRAGLIR
jgi:signal peptidase I